MKFSLALAILASLSLPLFAAEEMEGLPKYSQEYMKHWNTARQLTLAVADAMPADQYSFKPNPDEMSFGEQMVHIAGGNFSYCSAISGSKSPFKKPEAADKATAVQMLGESFDYCAQAVGGAKDLDAMRGTKTPVSVREIMLGAYAHMAHHRGQAEVYLRVKGIKPPDYKF